MIVHDDTTVRLNLKCQNPACKGYGTVHPNCKCFNAAAVGYAEGGECKGIHKEDCIYFDGGGLVPDGPINAPSSETPQETLSPDGPITPPSELTPDTEITPPTNYNTPMQQAGTAIEGALNGALPLGVTTAAELGLSKLGVPNMSAADIKGRQETNPWTYGISEATGLVGSELIPGIGQANLVSKVAKGSTLLKGALLGGLSQTGNEITNYLISPEGNDPTAAVSSALAHIGAATLLGGASEGIFNTVGKAVGKTVPEAAGNKALSWLGGLSDAADKSSAPLGSTEYLERMENDPMFEESAYSLGQKAFRNLSSNVSKAAGTGVGILAGTGIAGAPGAFAGSWVGKKVLSPIMDKILGPAFQSAGDYTVVPFANWLTSADKGLGSLTGSTLYNSLNWASNVAKGEAKISPAINSLFNVAKKAPTQLYNAEVNNNKLDQFLQAGGINTQINNQVSSDNENPGYAEGGEVKDPSESNTIHNLYPQADMMIAAAKTRISNYLNGLRPTDTQPKLTYDDIPDQTVQKRSYNKALDIANQPLKILNDVKDGSLDPEDLKHFTSLYPELHQHLQKKITERITQSQVEGEDPPTYKTRQALSAFMGAPLDGTLTPQNMQAAQATFQRQVTQGPPAGQPVPTKNKKSTSTLSKVAGEYKTQMDASSERATQTE